MTWLDVYFHSDRVGRLERLEQARLKFVYEPSWVDAGGAPLSLSLPVRLEPFEDGECRPFFAGLLPEGDFLKSIARAFQVSADNPFSVLTEIGGECAGAVSLASPGSEPPFVSIAPPTWLDDKGLGELLTELPRRPLLIGLDDEDEGVRLSLAGAQDKLPVLARDTELGITRGRPPSTHIIKAPIPDVEGMVVNEAFCMALAREVGLTAADACPIRAGGQDALLVTRYDRTRTGISVHRIHQEDFCQALGYLPEQKYESEGGPGIEACGQLLRDRSAAPALDLFTFLDALIFNLLIGNADAHSKNYSLLLEGEGSPRMAPLYDLLSTRVYGHRFGRKMAMKYGGEYRYDRIRGRHLDRLAKELGVSAGLTRHRVADLSSRIIVSREPARRRLPKARQDAEVIGGIEGVIEDAVQRLATAITEPA
ncbi:MAG TPA: type II toxin-antitoxin system HipA family toxin [Solirubrobacterales bacterium]|nr:type II toxin-antitoxin system HipA family toxin [Solirubrobacterales bacterium]